MMRLNQIGGRLPIGVNFVRGVKLAREVGVVIVESSGPSIPGIGPTQVSALLGWTSTPESWSWTRAFNHQFVDLLRSGDDLILAAGTQVSKLNAEAGTLEEPPLLSCDPPMRFRHVAEGLIVEEPDRPGVHFPHRAWLSSGLGSFVEVAVQPGLHPFAAAGEVVGWEDPLSSGGRLVHATGADLFGFTGQDARALARTSSGVVFVVHDPNVGTVVRLIDGVGNVLWQLELDRGFGGSRPATGNGRLRVINNRALVRSATGRLCEVDLVEGSEVWSVDSRTDGAIYAKGEARIALGSPTEVEVFDARGGRRSLSSVDIGGLLLHGTSDEACVIAVREHSSHADRFLYEIGLD